MKRIGLRQEFHGEGECAENWPLDAESHDEIILDVLGGTVSFPAPSDVPDDEVLQRNLADRYICCKLKLENGAELNLWIVEGAEGVDFRLEPEHRSRAHAVPAQ